MSAAVAAAPGTGVARRTRRVLAMLVLPASIVPVLVTGPALVRAPQRLWREISADIQGAHVRSAAGHFGGAPR